MFICKPINARKQHMQKDSGSRRRGRPSSLSPLRVVIGGRFTPAEADAVRVAAKDLGVTRSGYIRAAVVTATGHPDLEELGAVIRADRRRDLLAVAEQLAELVSVVRNLEPTDRDRRTIAGIRELLPELQRLHRLITEEAGS